MSEIESNSKLAHQLYKKKKYKEAAQMFWDIAAEYTVMEKKSEAAEMKNNASVAWLLAGDAQKALDAAEGTHLVFEALDNLKQAGMAYGNQAAAYQALNDHKTALEFYQKSSENLTQAGETEYKAIVLKQISQIQLQTGDHYQALASMNTALDSSDKLSGKEKFLQRFLKKIFK
ncbi:MAG: tetratricopeptide repeat protein [Anaerolineaceae bacterium]|nr:tetratricopeptide repeat protein [Anaerolineaceae bacterium]